jgi:myosin heavy subunit
MTRFEERRKLLQMEESAKNETQEKNRFIGENKQLIDQAAQAKATLESVQSQLATAQQSITKFESERDERAREHLKSITELENARKALADEQARVRREEEERRKKEEEERDRVWAVHEQDSLGKMKEACQKPELGFSFYEANNLPDGFDASVKPDFMIEFLGQYIIFDPKFSKSSNLAAYIKSQVKSSATKYKNSASVDLIYKTVFFVVPTVELNTLIHRAHPLRISPCSQLRSC